MNCRTEEVVRSSVGSVSVCQCGTVSIECNGNVLEIPKSRFTAFAGMIDVAFANIINRELVSKNTMSCCNKSV